MSGSGGSILSSFHVAVALVAALRRTWGRLVRRRVPVLLQMTADECGAACLAMVLSYHGRPTRVAECAEELVPGRDGLTALALARAARAVGLAVRAYSVAPAALARLPLPAIAHWEFAHFVVVERWTPRCVEIVDPGIGRRRLTPEEFEAGFTGVVLACEPGPGFARGGGRKTRRPWVRYLRVHVFSQPAIVAQVVAASLLLQGFGLALPLATETLVDDVLPRGERQVLGVLGAGAIVLGLAYAVAAYLRSALLLALQARVDGRIVPEFFDHLLGLPYRFFEGRSRGDLQERVASNALVRELLTGQVIATLLDGTLAIGLLAALLARDALVGAVVMGLGMAQAALLLGSGRRLHGLTQRELAATARAQSYLVEALAGVATLKAAGAEGRAVRRWSALFGQQLGAATRRGQFQATVDVLITGLRFGAPLGLLWWGAVRVLGGELSLGAMLGLNALAVATLMPLGAVVGGAQRLQLAAAHLDRLGDVLDAAPEDGATGAARPAPALSGRIELDGVGFRFGPDGPWVLRGVSAAIAPGQKVAIVGRSGAGKSTLAKLLLGLYDPVEGEIRYDGVPAAALERRSLRRQFGVVLQEPALFSGSIRDNVAFADPALPLARVAEAARLAAIAGEVASLPLGYETPVGEGGGAFSGGQRQRIALARALINRPAVLLLDEATSHLDAATEAEIEGNLSGLRCTRIVIAHRLSTVRDADLILVVEGGAIAERGRHDELLARGGLYARLVRAQAAVPDHAGDGGFGWPAEALAAD